MKMKIYDNQTNKIIARINPGTLSGAFSILLLFVFVSLSSWSSAQEVKVFRTPSFSPVSDKVPLSYSDSRRVLVFFRTTPEALRKLVPKPLLPHPNNIMGVMVCRWNAEGFQNVEYNDAGGKILEAALVTPVRLGKAEGLYTVVIYLDNASRLPMSREIWGFPKKLANVVVEETAGTFSSTVKIRDRSVMKLSFQRTEKVAPVPVSPPGNVFNLKIIPSIKRDAPPEVMQITSTKADFRIKEFWKGKASLEIGPLATDPLVEIPVLQIMSASESVIDGTMDYGEILHDYLKERK